MSDKPVSVTTFARALRISSRTARSWCQRGLIEGAWNVGANTKWLIPRATFEHYLGLADPADTAEVLANLPETTSWRSMSYSDSIPLLRARARDAQAALDAAREALQAAEEREVFQAKERSERIAAVAEAKATKGDYRA